MCVFFLKKRQSVRVANVGWNRVPVWAWSVKDRWPKDLVFLLGTERKLSLTAERKELCIRLFMK